MSREYSVKLTGGQLRVVHLALALILNDPDWQVSFPGQDWRALDTADSRIAAAWRGAARTESRTS